jgi:nucleotide-binding universal stress UspA family protein
MKILVPTDFSDMANEAYKVAIKIAGLTDGDLVLYHSLDFPEDWEKGDKESPEYLHALSEKAKAISAMKSWLKDAEQIDVEVNFELGTGNFIKSLKSVIAKNNIELIIMGSYGASGVSEWYIGSNAQKVVRSLRIPVLVIKEAITNIDFTNVMFATDLNSEDKNAMKAFIKFLKPFNPESFHILAINTLGYYKQPTIVMREVLKEFEKMVTEFPVKTHYYKDATVQKGIRHFSEENNISLIGISNHERHPIKRIFQGSNVEMLINHAHIPVLAIDY